MQRTGQLNFKRGKLFFVATIFVASLTLGCGSGTTSSTIPPSKDLYPSSSKAQWITEFYSTTSSSLPPTVIGDAATSVVGLKSGGAIVAGASLGSYDSTSPPGPNTRGLLAQYDDSGNKQWIRQYGNGAADTFLAVGIDSTQNIYTGGLTAEAYDPNLSPNPNGDAAVFGFDPKGVVRWTRQMHVAANYSMVSSIVVGSDGFLYVAGIANDQVNLQRAFVAKLSAVDGTVRWVKYIGSPSAFTAATRLVGSNDGLFVVGGSNGSDTSLRPTAGPFVLKLSTSDGSTFWEQSFAALTSNGLATLDGAAIASDGSLVLVGATAPLGQYFVVGPAAGSQTTNLAMNISSADGSIVWQTKFQPTTLGDQLSDVTVAPSGDIYALGYTNGTFNTSFQSAQILTLFQLAPSGSVKTVEQFGAGKIVTRQVPYPAALSRNDTGLFVAGITQQAFAGFTPAPNQQVSIFLGRFSF